MAVVAKISLTSSEVAPAPPYTTVVMISLTFYAQTEDSFTG